MSTYHKQQKGYCDSCEDNVVFEAEFEKEPKDNATLQFLVLAIGAIMFAACLIFLFFQYKMSFAYEFVYNFMAIIVYYSSEIERLINANDFNEYLDEFPTFNILAVIFVFSYLSLMFRYIFLSGGKETQTTFWTCKKCGSQLT